MLSQLIGTRQSLYSQCFKKKCPEKDILLIWTITMWTIISFLRKIEFLSFRFFEVEEKVSSISTVAEPAGKIWYSLLVIGPHWTLNMENPPQFTARSICKLLYFWSRPSRRRTGQILWLLFPVSSCKFSLTRAQVLTGSYFQSLSHQRPVRAGTYTTLLISRHLRWPSANFASLKLD